MGPPVTIFSGSTGLNNRVDPARLSFDLETGIIDLSEAVNVRFDKTGRPGRRNGFSLRHGGNFYSLFTRGNVGYVGLDDAVYKINPDLSLTGIRSGMTGNDIAYVWTPLGVIYSNGKEKGILSEDTSAEWVKADRVREESTRHFTGPPNGISHLEIFSSRILASVDDVLWRSLPNDHGTFRQGADYNQFPDRVRMVRAVAGGVYVSDEKRTYFLFGNNPEEWERKTVMECPAMEWSDMTDLIEPAVLGIQEASPLAVWVSADGLVYGTSQGQIIMPTKDRIKLPSGFMKGAIVIDGDNIIYNLHQ